MVCSIYNYITGLILYSFIIYYIITSHISSLCINSLSKFLIQFIWNVDCIFIVREELMNRFFSVHAFITLRSYGDNCCIGKAGITYLTNHVLWRLPEAGHIRFRSFFIEQTTNWMFHELSHLYQDSEWKRFLRFLEFCHFSYVNRIIKTDLRCFR